MPLLRTIHDVVSTPLYLAQGAWTLWKTPRLAEPTGPRSGHSGRGPMLRVLVAGDSSAAGVGATTQDEALTGHLTRSLAQHYAVSWRLVAKTALTARGLIDMIARTEPAPCDIAVLCLGVNDVTSSMQPRRWADDLRELIDLLTTRFETRHLFFSALPPVHLFPALPEPLRSYLGRRARAFNAGLQQVVRGAPNCTGLPELPLRSPTFMASDGFHPGPVLYAEWAAMVSAAVLDHFQVHPLG